MPRFPVQTYAAQWNPRSNKGEIKVVVQGKPYDLTIETVEEFTTTMLLLSKTNVICDTDNWDFELAFRPVGT
jgi:hypothetical protein